MSSTAIAIRKLEAAKRDLLQVAKVEATKVAFDLAASIKHRVEDKGLDANGSKFSGYSDKGVPYFLYKNAYARVPSAYTKIEAKVKSLKQKKTIGGQKNEFTKDSDFFISYKDWREANNLKTDKKNFEFSGDMWANFGTAAGVDIQASGNIVKITLAGGTQDAQNKIDWNSSQEGQSIIEASVKEINQAKQDLYAAINKHLQLTLNAI